MQRKELSLNKTIVFNTLSIILVQGISFFSTPIFSRLLGTNNYGVYSTFLAWNSIFTIVLPLSVESTIGIAMNEFPGEKQHSYQSSILTTGIISTALISVVLLVFCDLFSEFMGMSRWMLICLLLSSFFSFVANFANTRYTIELQANKNFILAAVSTILSISISLVLVTYMPSETNYQGRILGGVIASSIVAFIVLPVIYKDGKTLIKMEYVRFCLPLAIPVIFHALSNVVLNQSDRIMIQSMCSSSLAGIYGLAYSFTAIITVVYDAMNKSWIPFYYRFLGEGNREKLCTHAENYISLYTLITIGFLLVFKEVYSVFADRSYWGGTVIIPVLVTGLYFMFLYSFAINYEFYMKQTKFMAAITVSAAILNLILNYVLINKCNIMGAAAATLISYIYEFVIHYIYVRRMREGEYPFGIPFYLRPILMLSAGLTVYYVFMDYAIIRWSAAVAVGIYILFSIYKRRTIF